MTIIKSYNLEHNLINNLLIANSNIINPIFKRTVVYIFKKNQNEVMGIIINKPIKNLKIKNILHALKITPSSCLFGPKINNSVMMGGPESTERGFILHTLNKNIQSGSENPNKVFMTNSYEILKSTEAFEEPNKVLVALGCCIWNKHQITQELINHFWLIGSSNHDILFNIPFEERWQQAGKSIGINIYQIPNQFGHA